MKPFRVDGPVTLYHGDCLDVLRTLPDESVDSVTTDPPYALEFMGRGWDKFTPLEFELWVSQWAAECLRVLKPGGHMLAFGGSRTWHRLAAGIENAGFEIRDSIAWLTGSGFPKSLNVGKDERFCQCNEGDNRGGQGVEGVERRGADGALCALRNGGEAVAEQAEAAGAGVLLVQLPVDGSQRDVGGKSARPDGEAGKAPVWGGQPGVEGWRDAQAASGELHSPADGPVSAAPRGNGTVERVHSAAPSGHGGVGGPPVDAGRVRESHRPRHVEQRAVEPGTVADEPGSQARGVWPVCGGCGKQQVTGLGTALKPAFEPVVVARKPLTGTVAANVVAYGTGALNIDATRVGGNVEEMRGRSGTSGTPGGDTSSFRAHNADGGIWEPSAGGRWPTNVVLDESQAAELDRQSGITRDGVHVGRNRNGEEIGNRIYGARRKDTNDVGYGGSGGASRFFPTFRYEAKAPTSERPKAGEVQHPTVKPLDLMRWLVRLVTPPIGVVLEPFAGSGTTVEAAVLEGFQCIAIEREADYLPLIEQRLSKPMQQSLFDGLEGIA